MTYNVFNVTLNLALSVYSGNHLSPCFGILLYFTVIHSVNMSQPLHRLVLLVMISIVSKSLLCVISLFRILSYCYPPVLPSVMCLNSQIN